MFNFLRFMENRRAFNLRSIIAVYNVLQVISCGLIVVGVCFIMMIMRTSVDHCYVFNLVVCDQQALIFLLLLFLAIEEWIQL